MKNRLIQHFVLTVCVVISACFQSTSVDSFGLVWGAVKGDEDYKSTV